MMRNPRDPKDAKAIDEGTDAYDTIDWMIKNIPGNNGRVGLLGISYGGWLTVMGSSIASALKAGHRRRSPIDMWLGDDFHHNGAFRLAYGFGYAAMMESSKEISPMRLRQPTTAIEWYLKVGSVANINPNYLGGKIPTWNDFAGHPNYDKFWQKQARQGISRRPPCPPSMWPAGGTRGLLRPDPDLRGRRSDGTPGSRTCSSWGRGITAAGPAATAISWQDQVRHRALEVLSRTGAAPVLRALAQGRARSQAARSARLLRPAPTTGRSTTPWPPRT